MNLGEWLKSKKFKTAVLSAIVPFVAWGVGVPIEVALAACGGLWTAIVGFAHQDYGKARDALSASQLDMIATALVGKLAEKGKLDKDTADTITEAIEGAKRGDLSVMASVVLEGVVRKNGGDGK